MKEKSKLIGALSIFIILGSSEIKAQIGVTKSSIISKYGNNFKVGVDNEGINYLSYEKEVDNNFGGKCTQIKAHYFKKLDDGREICFFYKIIEPKYETNTWVAYFKKYYVEISDMKWKDYEQNLVYEVYVTGEFCIIDCDSNINK